MKNMIDDLKIRNTHNQLLKASEVAKVLNISKSKAYQLMQLGEIHTVRIGRSVRVLVSDLEDFINQHRSNGTKLF